ncbi:MAG TPA: amino acid permease [Ramlibacter sp.]|jgi:amino acid transporter|nr:amino acid permease [Ramlibacter sp.]
MTRATSTTTAAQAAPPGTLAEPAAVIGTVPAVMLIIGVVVGAGIFKAPSLVAGMAGSVEWMMGAWLLGGVISLIGALCYAELTTTWPHAGGDYHFLRRAYGPGVSFLFAWARFSVIATGSIALLAFVFADYMQKLLPLGSWGGLIYAAASVLVLWAVNARGILAGSSTQSWLTALEVGGLVLLVIAAIYLSFGPAPAVAAAAAAPAAAPSVSSFGLAMVFVLLTYGGWNEAAYISAEMRKQRDIVMALIVSIVVITALYMLVNWAYLRGLGFAGMAKSEAVAADLMRAAFGPTGDKVISALVAIAALTSMNATMIVGARTQYAVGRDWPVLSKLGMWDGARNTPVHAMSLQNITALFLVFLGIWTGGGFRAMVEFTAPVFWVFFLLVGISLFVLRVREPDRERPFRVPLYPVLPLVFCATCAYMLWSSLSYVHSQSLGGFNAAWIGVAVLAVGFVLLAVVRARSRAAIAASSPTH